MPINTVHPNYSANIDKWTRCRDTYNGDDAIKDKREQYLPKIDPNQTSNEYANYARRATFFEAVGKTVDGFIGAISRRPHKFDLPTSICALEVDATADGVSLAELVKVLCKETILQGRAGILVDYDGTLNRPHLTTYIAETIVNWSEHRIILSETVYEPDADDVYTLKAVEQYRELWLNDGVYTVTVWRKLEGVVSRIPEWVPYETIVPNKRGTPLDTIPFFWVTPLGQTSRIEKPPLLGLVNLSIDHYRLGADYAHGLHFTGLPTLYITGANDTEDTVSLGAASAILLKDAQAKVGFAEFTGQGLGALERAISATETKMAALGAAILGAEVRRPETATAAHLRHGSETSLLSAVVNAVQSSLQAALQFAADWMGTGKVVVELNDDFVSARLDPQTLLGLVQAYQVGALTLSSLLQAMQDGDLLPQKAVISDEVARLGSTPV